MICTLKGKGVMKTKECFISVDIETTGPVPGLYSLYELGACVIGDENLQFRTDLRLLPLERHTNEALKAVGIDDIHTLEGWGITSTTKAVVSFSRWVRKVALKSKPVFVANNAPFDWMFVAYYFAWEGVENPFGYSALDMKAYFMGMTGCSWKDATLKHMAEYANVPFGGLPHRALNDAIIQGKIFAALLHSQRKQP